MPSTTFCYDSALHRLSKTDTIRLLDLEPGEADSPVSSQLRTVSLSTQPVYTAISYCWGSETPSNIITCNEQPLSITSNLDRALRQFRDPTNVVTLWADAVCINQEDVLEKNQQVPLMGRIYGQASQVRVWLDPGAHQKDTKRAGERITELVELAHHYSEKLSIPLDELCNSESSAKWSKAQYDAAEKQKPHEKWDPLFDLLLNPWFTRMWIVQEVSLASECAMLHYGDTNILWNDVVVAMCFSLHTDWFTRPMSVKGDEKLPLAVGRVTRLVRTTVAVRNAEGAGASMLWLLLMHRAAMSTDPRDKVYGVLSIACNEDAGGPDGLFIAPDYHLSAATLYQLVMEKFMGRFPSIDILGLAGLKMEQNDSSVEDLPSWVIDWSDPVSMAATLPPAMDKHLESPDANQPGSCRLDKYGKWYQVEGNVLKVRGYLFDEIVEARDIFVTGQKRLDFLGQGRTERASLVYQVFSDIADFWGYSSKEDVYAPTGEPLLNVMFRQICRDQPPEWFAVCDPHPRELLQSWIEIGREVKRMTESSLSLSGEQLEDALRELTDRNPSPLPVDETVKVIRMCLLGMGINVPYRSRKGYIGLSMSRTIRVGDQIALIQGATMPMMLRRRQRGGHCWTLNGEVIVQGIMRGQAFDIDLCEELNIV